MHVLSWGQRCDSLPAWSQTLITLFAEALALPDHSRLQLVERLIPMIQSEPSLEAEQVQEVRRRMNDVRSGRVKTIPGERVFNELSSR